MNESYVVSGHGLTENQEMILVPGAVQTGESISASPNSIYSHGSCGTNMAFDEEPTLINNLFHGHDGDFISHSFLYHDSRILVCSYFFGEPTKLSCDVSQNKNRLNITPSGLYRLNQYKQRIKLGKANIIYSRVKNETALFYISLGDVLRLYEGAIYPTPEIIRMIFRSETMLFSDFIKSPYINMKISDLIKYIPNATPYKLYVLACRGFERCVSMQDRQRRLDSSGDSAIPAENTPDENTMDERTNPVEEMLFDDNELDDIAETISTKNRTKALRKKSRVSKFSKKGKGITKRKKALGSKKRIK